MLGSMAIGLNGGRARGRNGIEFAFMPFFPIRRFARAFGSPYVIQRFGCDHLVTSPRTVAPSPNISSLLPELPGAISVAPCCPCTVLARIWRHKALRGRVIHMICQACIRTYTQRANSSQPTSDVPACATRARSHERVPFTPLGYSFLTGAVVGRSPSGCSSSFNDARSAKCLAMSTCALVFLATLAATEPSVCFA